MISVMEDEREVLMQASLQNSMAEVRVGFGCLYRLFLVGPKRRGCNLDVHSILDVAELQSF